METQVGINPILKYNKNGQLLKEEWSFNNKFHRIDGPAEQKWYKTGRKNYELWYLNGVYHRENGPSENWWFNDGNDEFRSWHINGKLHRINGPAVYRWDQKGKLIYELWFINGNRFPLDKVEDYKKWLIDYNLTKKNYSQWTDDERVLWRLTWV